MNCSIRRIAAIFLGILLSGCGGVGIIESNDPYAKLSTAQYLAEGPGRIMRARQQIDEAAVILEQRGDKAGLSEVNRLYGLLERAGATKDVILMNGGINAKEPTTENIDRSEPYFAKALELATEAQAFDKVVNINFLLVVNRKYRGTPLEGCVYLDRALAAAKQAHELHPDKEFQIPPQFKTPEEWVAAMKMELGCPVK